MITNDRTDSRIELRALLDAIALPNLSQVIVIQKWSIISFSSFLHCDTFGMSMNQHVIRCFFYYHFFFLAFLFNYFHFFQDRRVEFCPPAYMFGSDAFLTRHHVETWPVRECKVTKTWMVSFGNNGGCAPPLRWLTLRCDIRVTRWLVH